MSIANFKRSLFILNQIVYFDDNDFLREKSSNVLEMQKIIMKAEELLNQTKNEEELYFIYGTLGNLYRIIGQPKKALVYLTFCLDFAQKKGNIRKEIVSLIRLGEAQKYDNQHLMALETINEALKKCIDHDETDYKDFILQHKGKCLMELGKLEEAEKCLLKSLNIRKMKNDNTLITSTQKALDFVYSMKNSN